MMKSMLGWALGVLVIAGCAASPTTGTSAAERTPQAHVISTHCGINSTYIDGGLWLADPPQGQHNPPPGWDENEQTGQFVFTSSTTAEFTSDAGDVNFVRANPGTQDPKEGCE